MAHADWKRYYGVIVEGGISGKVRLYGPCQLFKSHASAVELVNWLKRHSTYLKPIGIAAIRGTKHNPQLQTWLLENSS